MTTTIIAIDMPVARPSLRGLAWVTYRQHRTMLLVLTGVVAACSLILFYYGHQMHSAFGSLGLSRCYPGARPSRGQHVNCSDLIAQFRPHQNRVSQLMAVFLPLPVIFGLFLGAPLLAREYESGTYRFAFTQGAGRTRWLVTKVALMMLVTIVLTSLFTLVVIWWYGPLTPLDGRIGNTGIPEIYGTVVVGRAVFALALGILAGALLRRVVPAIGSTLVGWIAVVVVSITSLRPHLMRPLTAVDPTTDPRGWITSDVWKAPSGRTLTHSDVARLEYGASAHGHKADLYSYLFSQGNSHTVTYQPANRFWPLQFIETGGLVVVSIILIVAAVWLVRRRAA